MASELTPRWEAQLRELLQGGLVECEPYRLERGDSPADEFLSEVHHALKPAIDVKLITEPTPLLENGAVMGVTFRAGGEPRESRVGVVGLGAVDGEPISLHVRPKVQGCDWLGLIALAEGWNDVKFGDRPAQAEGADDPILLLISVFTQSLESLVDAGGIRRHFDARAETLRGRVRGQLDLGTWVQNLAGGRPDRVPCRFTAHDVDNLPNRMLLRALTICQSVFQTVGAGRARGWTEALDRLGNLSPMFAGVGDDPRIGAGAVERSPTLPRSFAHYETSGAWPLALMILRQAVPAHEAGAAPMMAFTLEMPKIYEGALRRALGGLAAQWTYRVGDQKSKDLKPDIVVERGDATYIVDAKWKAVIVNQDADDADDLNKVIESDIYQVMAYAEYWRRTRPTPQGPEKVIPVLVYPSPSEMGAEVWPVVFSVDRRETPVCVLAGWPVGRAANGTVGGLGERAWQAVEAARDKFETTTVTH